MPQPKPRPSVTFARSVIEREANLAVIREVIDGEYAHYLTKKDREYLERAALPRVMAHDSCGCDRRRAAAREIAHIVGWLMPAMPIE